MTTLTEEYKIPGPAADPDPTPGWSWAEQPGRAGPAAQGRATRSPATQGRATRSPATQGQRRTPARWAAAPPASIKDFRADQGLIQAI